MRRLTSARFVATGLCTAVVIGAFGARVKSYATEGPKWPTNQVVYYVNPQNLYLSDAAAVWAIQTGAAAWRDQSGANIQLVYGGTTSGSSLTMNNKNEVFFRNDSSGFVAETYWWFDGSNHFIDADIVMHENYVYFAGSGCSKGVYLEEVATHEFGHALGLAHSSVPDATMEPAMPDYCDTSQLTLEADDISGIRTLYPPSTSSPIPSSAPSNSAPTLSISSPSNKSAYAYGETVTFAASANDTQDGNLSGRIAWSSSIDGSIGNGGSLSRTLSPGVHTVTAMVTDTGGLNASSQVMVTVADPVTSATPTPVATSGPTLSARAYRVKGSQKVDLTWSGLSGSLVDVNRDGALAFSTANDGVVTDDINKKGNGSYTYQVCEAGTATCTNIVATSF